VKRKVTVLMVNAPILSNDIAPRKGFFSEARQTLRGKRVLHQVVAGIIGGKNGFGQSLRVVLRSLNDPLQGLLFST
jgi:hypothetical protein